MEKRKNRILWTQVLVALLMLLAPSVIHIIIFKDMNASLHILANNTVGILPIIGAYFLQFYLLIPIFEKKGTAEYALWSFMALLLYAAFQFCAQSFSAWYSRDTVALNDHLHQVTSFLFGQSWVYIFIAGLAWVVYRILKSREYQRLYLNEKNKNMEAELAWLKNQLNPHFLFNTLNNISALTQLDADLAQQSIEELSDLLRYSIYDTREETVPVGKEVAFMKNYISLMKLRCDDNTTVTTSFHISNERMPVPPLLFISFIENAFKHGVDSERTSFVNIMMNADHQIRFVCKNSNYPKKSSERSGSGIGMANTRRRLELLYPGRHQLSTRIEGDTFIVKLIITPEKNGK